MDSHLEDKKSNDLVLNKPLKKVNASTAIQMTKKLMDDIDNTQK